MNWYIKVRDMVYGPYSASRMSQFADEGRLGLKTLVSDNRDEGFAPADQVPALLEILSHKKPSTAHSLTPNSAKGELKKIVLYTDFSSIDQADFASQLAPFGEAFAAMSGIWLLKSHVNCAQLRNALSKNLSASDNLLIFEIHNDQAAWFNIGEQQDRQFREFLS